MFAGVAAVGGGAEGWLEVGAWSSGGTANWEWEWGPASRVLLLCHVLFGVALVVLLGTFLLKAVPSSAVIWHPPWPGLNLK